MAEGNTIYDAYYRFNEYVEIELQKRQLKVDRWCDPVEYTSLRAHFDTTCSQLLQAQWRVRDLTAALADLKDLVHILWLQEVRAGVLTLVSGPIGGTVAVVVLIEIGLLNVAIQACEVELVQWTLSMNLLAGDFKGSLDKLWSGEGLTKHERHYTLDSVINHPLARRSFFMGTEDILLGTIDGGATPTITFFAPQDWVGNDNGWPVPAHIQSLINQAIMELLAQVPYSQL